MIIFQINVIYMAVIENECNAPIASNANTPFPLPIPKRMESVPRHVDIIKRFSLIKDKQDPFGTSTYVRTDTPPISLFVKAFQPSMPDTFDHGLL